MAEYISEELIDRISEQADIVQIIGEYLPLKKAGKNYKTLCPFHQERTPSFVVSPEKQLFHCFGCGIGGNVFTFIMKWEKVSFPEAVKVLGDRMGILVRAVEDKERVVYKEELYRINEQVASFFQQRLDRNQTARRYLEDRGFEEETLGIFKVGYASSSREFLEFCQKKGFSFERLRDLGLVVPSKEGKGYYAYFRDRIIFPIFTSQGKICGFGGRVLDSSLPKYLNSPQSPVFDKGKVLYGLNFSKEEIRREGEAILVEGYTDVLSLYQAGIRNVIASLGTSLTHSQARLIKRYMDTVFIAYDPDRAGVAAALRGIDLLLEADLRIRVISLPEGFDPAELLARKEGEVFTRRKNQALPYFNWRLNLEIPQGCPLEPEDKVRIIDALFSTLSKVKNEIKLRDYIGKLAHRLNLDESLVGMELEKFKRKEKVSVSEFFKTGNDQERMEEMLLRLMLSDVEIARMVKERWNVNYFESPFYKEIAQKVIFSAEREEMSSSKLINKLRDENLSSFISSSSLSEDSFKGSDRKRIVLDLIETLHRNRRQKKIDELRGKIEKEEEEGQEEKVREHLNELIRLKKQILLR